MPTEKPLYYYADNRHLRKYIVHKLKGHTTLLNPKMYAAVFIAWPLCGMFFACECLSLAAYKGFAFYIRAIGVAILLIPTLMLWYWQEHAFPDIPIYRLFFRFLERRQRYLQDIMGIRVPYHHVAAVPDSTVLWLPDAVLPENGSINDLLNNDETLLAWVHNVESADEAFLKQNETFLDLAKKLLNNKLVAYELRTGEKVDAAAITTPAEAAVMGIVKDALDRKPKIVLAIGKKPEYHLIQRQEDN